ncbi:MAG: PIG-L family deacetylase [Panacibacter sp.]
MKQFIRIFCIVLFTFYFSFIKAQTPATYNSADIYLQLKKLNVLGSVLYIAAHPDDENTRLLAYLSKEKQYRTGYLSLTRGDGGQNLIGDEQGIELGLIRTQELLSARRMDGAEQFFSRAYDFGFCKTAKEAMDTWGHDKILSDVVWVIRKFQPDVIITRFPGDERAGHGHHQASNLLAVEAFKAAADPNMFPEQLKLGVQIWQAKRILWNTFNFGSTNTTDSTQFKMDVGVYSSLLGKSYGEIASESRSQHKSQGFGVPRQRGQAYEYFKTLNGDAPTNDLMDGIAIDWKRADNSEAIELKINDIISHYNFEHPENSVGSLVELYKAISNSPKGYWQSQKAQEVKNLVFRCSGIFADVTSTDEYAVQGSSFNVQFFINKRNNSNAVLKNIQLLSFDSSFTNNLSQNQNISFNKSFNVPVDAKISQPYWLEKPLQSGSFDVSDQQMIGKPQSEAAYTAILTFTIEGFDFTINRNVQYKFTDPVKGELYEPFRIEPAVTGMFNENVYVLDGAKQKELQLELKSKKALKNVDINIAADNGWKINGGAYLDSLKKDATVDVKAVLSTTSNTTANITVAVKNITDAAAQSYTQPLMQERKILYDHIPTIVYYKPLAAKAEKIDVITKGKTIGYITGAGDKVPQSLQQLGYTVKTLTEANITDDYLKQFDAVIAGIRAYNTQDWLTGKYDVLMRYIKNGGNYIVQYNTNNFISNVSNKIGPYPFTVSRTRVTDENAKVTVLLPNNSALNYPNKITEKDFTGWLQERSIYQAEQLDTHYEAPFSMHDANEPETNGSLIIGKYGKGNFVYTGLVFFRELPAGVPGAYRLMANLIALPKNKVAE